MDLRSNGSIPTGSVMVVGGGIAGMQASLDLADQGFRVFLVESKSAIGGHMAQLDKTFPTNDCAMCTISPKLVETGRHINIDIMVDTELVGVNGEAGNFTATLRRKPRYIDPLKCIACGECVEVCPVYLPDAFNARLTDRRAAYQLYPQAIPNAYAIEKLGVAPCRDACPAGQRAQGYIAMIREGRYDEALRVIKEDNPFPGICGRICNHRCEQACNRGVIDEPVNIRALKRFVTDQVYKNPRKPRSPVERIHDQSVAIIGAGPCGLTAAQDLASHGYGVTVYEALPVAGGMLRVGVPEYRLPTEIIEREVADILDLGIDLRLNTRVDDLEELFEEGHDAVLVAVGAHEGIRLPIPGAELEGVLINTSFLRDVRLGRCQADQQGQMRTAQGLPFGPRVLVLGGGNVAVDCARTAVRLGAEVQIACLEPRQAMLSHEWELVAAEEEGIIIHPDRTFLRVVPGKNGSVAGVECARVKHFEFGTDGRLQVETEPGSEHLIDADTVIFSVGQHAGLALIPDDVSITPQRTIAVSLSSMATTRPGVFAAGDGVSGTSFVIEAVASGHQAAESIIRYLQGDDLAAPAKPALPVVNLTREDLQPRLDSGAIKPAGRLPVPEIALEGRLVSFDEIERGYDDQSAKAEADRCLQCALCAECLSCVYACDRDAIDHDMVETIQQIEVGAVILAPGYQVYRAELSKEYGFGRYPNVVTALQLERLLSASGPTAGHVQRPSDGAPARKIAFLQCVGSRDLSHDYCSAVCCMYAAKEAIMIREHDPQAQVHIFMMDMRSFSKGYEAYYRQAREKYAIEYTRCRISGLREDPETGNLVLRYMQDQGSQIGDQDTGLITVPQSQIIDEAFDLVVLSVGMEISESVKELGRQLGVELDEYGFCSTPIFNPLETSRPGIFAVGPFREPKDIPESIVDASGAAGQAAGLLAPARGSLTRTAEYPPELEVEGDEARIGVFVCHCGSNIGGFLDVPNVAEFARTLPNVVHTEHSLYTCSQDSIATITERVKDLNLNRVVVAACTPLTHAPLFRDSIRSAGLNPALFEMANIRNQCSWVHSHDWDAATEKAKELVSMAAARAATLEPLKTMQIEIEHEVLVVGGGVAGMTAALSLAEGGFGVHLVEREANLGGNLRHILSSINGQDPQAFLKQLKEKVESAALIHLYLEHEVAETHGFKGRFRTILRNRDSAEVEINHGATILATGAQEYRGSEYSYHDSRSVVTGLEFSAMLAKADGKISDLEGRALEAWNSLHEKLPDEIAMILCVGPADQFCGRICCSTALKNALDLKRIKPDARVTILYKDIRTYGAKESLYTAARRAGIIFIRYDDANLPAVNSAQGSLNLQVVDPNLGCPIAIEPDLLVLSTPAVPTDGSAQLASQFKVPVDSDGFFLEAHVKLRPVDFSTEGLFMAGMAHYPKLLDETIVHAQAAAARAARLLSQPSFTVGGSVAQVDPSLCVGCLTCVRACPFDVPLITAEFTGVADIAGTAYIEPSICRGCGICVAECPAKAIQLAHYQDDQIMVKLDALLARQ